MPTAAAAAAPMRTLCGSLSQFPVALGAAMHNAGYQALGLPFTYVPFAVSDLAGAIAGMRALGIRGLGISMPFKLRIMELLDTIDPLAARIGAVNTVVNDDGHLVGHNTDGYGAARALEESLPLAGARVLVIGAGGAARAVAHGLIHEGSEVTITNRSTARGKELADATSARWRPWPVCHDGGYDAVVNASSLGQQGVATAAAQPQLPYPAAGLHDGLVVMDIVYKPLDTPLLQAARARGARVIHGARMLLHQGVRQFELYTGRPGPLDAMALALEQSIAAEAD